MKSIKKFIVIVFLCMCMCFAGCGSRDGKKSGNDIVIVNMNSEIYHEQHSQYVEKMNDANKLLMLRKEAEKAGYRKSKR